MSLQESLSELQLKCSIPVFDGLLPEPYNATLLTLLFRLAEWHALAKLRMHTDTTLTLLKAATVTLGNEMRNFHDKICPNFNTKLLPGEVAARDRRR